MWIELKVKNFRPPSHLFSVRFLISTTENLVTGNLAETPFNKPKNLKKISVSITITKIFKEIVEFLVCHFHHLFLPCIKL